MAGDDDSDEDIGKNAAQLDNLGLDYDSDEGTAPEASAPQSELIDLGGSSGDNRQRGAQNIPKLSGPR